MTSLRRRASLAGVLLCFAAPSPAQSIRDFWSERQPIRTIMSPKSAAELEMCLGLQAGETGIPAVLHGDKETRISVVLVQISFATAFGFRILDEGASRRVEVWARGSALGTWEKRALAAADTCAGAGAP